jgi:hypothetical protein
MKTRRDFLNKLGVGAASALSIPILSSFDSAPETRIIETRNSILDTKPKFLVPAGNALKITGTFIDEISHDIPHQNWGEKEWDRDFAHMKAIGIDTVIMIRSGYRKFITYDSDYLVKQGCYKPSVDLLEMYLRLADKHKLKFYFGLYDSGKYWDTGDMTYEIESNKFVIEEAGLQERETLVGVVAGIVDVGIQPQEDAEMPFVGSDEDEAEEIERNPRTYFKDEFDPWQHVHRNSIIH